MSIYDIDGNIIVGNVGELPNTVILGDSICTYPDLTYGEWIDWMRDYVSFDSLKTYAVGGAVWAVNSDQSTMYKQFLTLKSEVDNGRVAPDLIVIDAGINDVAYSTPIGTVADAFNGQDILSSATADVNTLYKSIRYTCEAIIAEYPTAQIILVTPYQSGLPARDTAVRNVRDCITESAARLSLPVINQTDELGIYGYNESVSPRCLNSDGTHPSTVGKRLMAKFVSKRLAELVLPS